ncbi:unnamed protein product [Coccothraustes coccothraustes]
MLNEKSAGVWPFGNGDRIPRADRAEGRSPPGCGPGWEPQRHRNSAGIALLRASGTPNPDGCARHAEALVCSAAGQLCSLPRRQRGRRPRHRDARRRLRAPSCRPCSSVGTGRAGPG